MLNFLCIPKIISLYSKVRFYYINWLIWVHLKCFEYSLKIWVYLRTLKTDFEEADGLGITYVFTFGLKSRNYIFNWTIIWQLILIGFTHGTSHHTEVRQSSLSFGTLMIHYTGSHQAFAKQLSGSQGSHKLVIRQSLNVVDFCHHA